VVDCYLGEGERKKIQLIFFSSINNDHPHTYLSPRNTYNDDQIYEKVLKYVTYFYNLKIKRAFAYHFMVNILGM
jgi:hypothetical protein